MSMSKFTTYADYVASVPAIDKTATLDRISAMAAEAQAEAQMKRDAARYRWLRDGKSDNRGWCGSAPYVIDPRRSRLYAMADLRSQALDVSIDADIFGAKVNELHHHNEIVERGLLPAGASTKDFDGPYIDALYALAKKELGFTDQQFAAVIATEQ